LNTAAGWPIIGSVPRVRLLILLALATALLASAAQAKTPLPTKQQGAGNESTAGGGVMPGKSFSARSAVAVLDISFDQIRIYLFPKRVACSDVAFADPPFVVVTVDTSGSPLLVGRPSLQNGKAFVQVDFHPATGGKYFAIQPGASITFTRLDPARNSLWHGSVTVKLQHFQGHLFSYRGTFAARWCGKN
jgi:hypothetical protein